MKITRKENKLFRNVTTLKSNVIVVQLSGKVVLHHKLVFFQVYKIESL